MKEILNANVIKKLNNVCNTPLISKNQEEPPTLSVSGAEDNFVTSNIPYNKVDLKNEDIFSENLLNDKIILEKPVTNDNNLKTLRLNQSNEVISFLKNNSITSEDPINAKITIENDEQNLNKDQIGVSVLESGKQFKVPKVSKRKSQSETKSQQNGTKKILKANVTKKSNNNHKSSLISKSVEPGTKEENLKTLYLNKSNEVTSFLKNNSITSEDLMNDKITMENVKQNLNKDQIEVPVLESGKQFKLPKVSKRERESRIESKQKELK
ncbi:hypothetical protein CEXT_81081 [Caerostris extrusa]|uniref:Uncharacterized protein n=1 Tax=Caerostris extrusa TaxID=172846 RepID=A0AAV4Y2W8_CAEEX|nr:hypothetical protein CEXT_81081 [Caerostris extrusa]